jgi:hypothetical protein
MASDAPFAWICRGCRLHTERDLPDRETAEREARRHFSEAHPGRPPKFTVVEGFARCQFRRRRFFSRICGAPASWTHAPIGQVHLCAVHASAASTGLDPEGRRADDVRQGGSSR